MENFDVLNEMGEFTNEIASREECHKKGLYHKAVVVFIINSKNEVLIQQRSSNKKLWPSKWDITAGGHVDAGEFGYEAVIRETKEEIGIDITEKDLLFIGSTISHNEQKDIIKTEKIIYGSWLPSTNYIVDENWNFELYVGNDCYLYIPIKN